MKVCYLSCVNTGNGNNLFTVKPELKISWAFVFWKSFLNLIWNQIFFFGICGSVIWNLSLKQPCNASVLKKKH